MELHSYAKRRTLKKWSIEQKRNLVEARIDHDDWFTNKPSGSTAAWRKILLAANLIDFNVFFVKKQWSTMLARYQQYKLTRLDVITSKDVEVDVIKCINEEWEFFEQIHKFMTRKTTNLHSYALTYRTENSNLIEPQEKGEKELLQTARLKKKAFCHHTNYKCTTKSLINETVTMSKDSAKVNIPNTTTIISPSNISPDDGMYLCSSDTNDEYQVSTVNTRIMNADKRKCPSGEFDKYGNMNIVRNTDHDFYSKKSSLERPNGKDLQEQQLNYFADASEQSQDSSNAEGKMLQTSKNANGASNAVSKLEIGNDSKIEDKSFKKTSDITDFDESLDKKAKTHGGGSLDNMPSTSAQNKLIPTKPEAIDASNVSKLETGNDSKIEDKETKKTEGIPQSDILDKKTERHDRGSSLNDMPSTSAQNKLRLSMQNKKTALQIKRTIRDKYYRHRKRHNRRMEKRFDSFLLLITKIIQQELPSIDVSSIVDTVTSISHEERTSDSEN